MLTSPGWAGQQHNPRIGGLDFLNESHKLVDAARSSEKSGTIGGFEGGQPLIGTSSAGDLR